MAAVLCLVLTGCGRDLSHVEMIRVVGVENGKTNFDILLTAVSGGEESELYTTEGKDLLEAQDRLREQGRSRLELTHITAVVLGRVEELEEVLWQQVNHRKSGYGATVWLAGDGSPQRLLQQAEQAAQRLESLRENGGIAAPTLMEALRDLEEEGQTTLPVLEIKEGELRVTAWRVIGTNGEEKE